MKPSTVQISYSHVTLIFQLRFLEGELNFRIGGCKFREASRKTTAVVGEF